MGIILLLAISPALLYPLVAVD